MAEQGADDMQTLFYKDVTAMNWYSDLGVIPNTKQLNPGLAGKIGIMPIPARTAEQQPVLRMIAQYYSIGKGSPNVDVAKDYIKHLLKVENEVKIIKSVPLGNVPAIPAAKDSPDLWADPDIAANKQLYLDYIDMAEKYGRAIAIAEHPGVFNPMSGRIMSEGLLIGCVQDVVLNGVPADQAAATWAAKMEELVAKG
jgi:multiple sugar transport system substrate-binding protein